MKTGFVQLTMKGGTNVPKIKEQEHVRIKEKSTQEGKEQITKVADEKMVTTKAEAEKTEAPKKKKNIIRVYHAQSQ